MLSTIEQQMIVIPSKQGERESHLHIHSEAVDKTFCMGVPMLYITKIYMNLLFQLEFHCTTIH